MLASHVVCGGQDLGKWGPAQHESLAIGVAHGVGQVGSPTGDQGELIRRLSTGDVCVEPRADPTNIDALHKFTP